MANGAHAAAEDTVVRTNARTAIGNPKAASHLNSFFKKKAS